ncbi:MAG: DUF2127 domain-containing protein [Actinobacteria bacterium]|nr:DUF2127 domain-containing protein [Actinomycetota bacterium]
MEQKHWFNTMQPQTLQLPVILMYINAGFTLLGLIANRGSSVVVMLAIIIALSEVLPAWGIANDRKWGYYLGLGITSLYLILVIMAIVVSGMTFISILSLMFAGAMVALLLHRESREYQRMWFR